jgi:ferredoxin
VVVVLGDEVPAGEQEHAREAIRLCPAGALREISQADPE